MLGRVLRPLSRTTGQRLTKESNSAKNIVVPRLKFCSKSQQPSDGSVEINIDVSGLKHMRPMVDVSLDATATTTNTAVNVVEKEPMTELGEDLNAYIGLRGPISVHDYMTQCLNHPIHGYYQRKGSMKIGGIDEGDFITSPEISQLFGEIIAVWLISTWKSLGSPSRINLVEMGPGNGTLMADILRASKHFKEFHRALVISMMELSADMRAKQREKLKCVVRDATDLKRVKYQTQEGIPISWYNFMSEIPSDCPTLIVGHEFLDIYPVHQFVYSNSQWREKLIDVDTAPDSVFNFRTVISPTETPAVRAILGDRHDPSKRKTAITETLQHSEASNSGVAAVDQPHQDYFDNVKEGDCIEISPLSLGMCEDVAMRLKKTRGAALFIDYGENFTQGDTIRGYRKHKQVHHLSEPGTVDITADVDFGACKKIATKSGAKVYTAVTQSEFLLTMGIIDRVEKLVESPDITDEQAVAIIESVKKIIEPQGMGGRFKAICICDKETSVYGFGESS